jgi:hypothetical protein
VGGAALPLALLPLSDARLQRNPALCPRRTLALRRTRTRERARHPRIAAQRAAPTPPRSDLALEPEPAATEILGELMSSEILEEPCTRADFRSFQLVTRLLAGEPVLVRRIRTRRSTQRNEDQRKDLDGPVVDALTKSFRLRVRGLQSLRPRVPAFWSEFGGGGGSGPGGSAASGASSTLSAGELSSKLLPRQGEPSGRDDRRLPWPLSSPYLASGHSGVEPACLLAF